MKKVTFFVIAVGLLLGSCSTSYITTSWKSDNATAKQYKKILVLGLIGDPDRSIRDKMEEHLAGDLKDLGYNAVTSVSVYGPKAFENTNERKAIDLLNNQGFDAVVTIVLLNKAKEKYYVPGRINYSPYEVQHNRFWGYYSAMNERVNSPGYYSINTTYFWESNLFDLSGSKLVYSVQSQSFDPESAQKLGHEYGLMIIHDMVKQNVLQTQTTPALKSF
jgi:hypothetical protein